jgi:hypothetical protein
MTSFLISATAAPVLLALVPCVFSQVKTPETGISRFVSEPVQDIEVATAEAHTPWWKPQALGIDNYS